MSIKRIVAVGFIFFMACVGWWILGIATAVRSTDFTSRLGYKVENLWGTNLEQEAPSAAAEIPGTDQMRWLMPSKSDIKVEINTDYRKKGLIWYSTYICSFDGTYTISNTEEVGQKIRLHFNFPSKKATYDDFFISIDGEPLLSPINTEEGLGEIIELAPGASKRFHIAYKTRGMREWHYKMAPNVGRVKNFHMEVTTNFKDIDYTDGSLSPMLPEETTNGMVATWSAADLITNQEIGIIIPEKLNPGPLTSRITFFAPVCLLFFFVLVGTINILYKVNIHPMHYLFVAAGFFAFHLLLAYMVGKINNVHVSFIICAVISVALVTSYLSAALKGKFPWKIAVAGQLFFLVLFSYSFFLKGATGLTVAIGSVVTLAILMRVTAHIDWSETFARRSKKKDAVVVPPLPVQHLQD
ncbi:inner membrane CreD family protein [Verrucomicrobiota bacterium]